MRKSVVSVVEGDMPHKNKKKHHVIILDEYTIKEKSNNLVKNRRKRTLTRFFRSSLYAVLVIELLLLAAFLSESILIYHWVIYLKLGIGIRVLLLLWSVCFRKEYKVFKMFSVIHENTKARKHLCYHEEITLWISFGRLDSYILRPIAILSTIIILCIEKQDILYNLLRIGSDVLCIFLFILETRYLYNNGVRNNITKFLNRINKGEYTSLQV